LDDDDPVGAGVEAAGAAEFAVFLATRTLLFEVSAHPIEINAQRTKKMIRKTIPVNRWVSIPRLYNRARSEVMAAFYS